MLKHSAYVGETKIIRLPNDKTNNKFFLDKGETEYHKLDRIISVPLIGSFFRVNYPKINKYNLRKHATKISDLITSDFAATMTSDNDLTISVHIISGLNGGTIRELNINSFKEFLEAPYTEIEGHFPIIMLKYKNSFLSLDLDLWYDILKKKYTYTGDMLEGGFIFYRKSDNKVLYLTKDFYEEYSSVKEFKKYRV